MITFTTEHLAEALALLPEQFKGKETIAALLGTWLRQVQDLEDTFGDLFDNLNNLETTVAGVLLDTLGVVLGVERNGRTDEAYRTRLRAQIVINTSSGTIEDVLAALVGAGVDPVLVEEGDAAIRVEAIDPLDEDTATSAVELISGVRGAGIRTHFTYPSGVGPFFSFGPAADIGGDSAGFDDGAFVGAVEVES